MFSRFDGGRIGPYILPAHNSDDPIRLNERLVAGWAFPLDIDGCARGSLPRRPHRGMLPDVDFSRAVPAAPRPGLLAGLFRPLVRILAGRPKRGEAADRGPARSGAGGGVLG